jgi:hypothetical protein
VANNPASTAQSVVYGQEMGVPGNLLNMFNLLFFSITNKLQVQTTAKLLLIVRLEIVSCYRNETCGKTFVLQPIL